MSETNGTINREQFLAKHKTKRVEYVTLPDGSKLKLQSIPATERIEKLDQWTLKDGKPDKSKLGMPRMVRALQLCAVNEDGSRLFNDEDFDELMQSESGWIEDAAVAAARLVIGEIEDKAKNS